MFTESAENRVTALTASKETGPMTPNHTAGCCAPRESHRSPPAAAQNMAADWGKQDGSSRGQYLGFINSEGFACGMNVVLIFMRPSCALAVSSFAATPSRGFVRGSKGLPCFAHNDGRFSSSNGRALPVLPGHTLAMPLV